MEKRLPLALFLSFLILFGWQAAFGTREPEPEPGEGTAASEVEAAAPGESDPTPGLAQPDPAPAPDVVQAEPWEDAFLIGPKGDPGRYLAHFDNRGAVLRELRLDGYYLYPGLGAAARELPENWVPLALGVESAAGFEGSLALTASVSSFDLVSAPLEQVHWDHELLLGPAGDTVGVRFTHDGGRGVTFEKSIRSVLGSYELEIELALTNTKEEHRNRKAWFNFTPSLGMPGAADDNFYMEPRARSAYRVEGELEIKSHQRDYGGGTRSGAFPGRPGQIAFAGVDNKYFAMLLRSADAVAESSMQDARWRLVYDTAWVRDNGGDSQQGFRGIATEVGLELNVPAPGQESRYTFRLFAGPKERRVMVATDADLGKLIESDLGFFNGIAGLLLRILGFFYSLVGNWGFSIILLTLFVRMALFPFNRRSQVSMARHQTKMKRIQPRLDEVKKKYEKDPKRVRQEHAKIMQEEGAFPPLGGCLPIFVQIPIFFGLFSALRVSSDLRQAPFIGWIRDLSAPDRLLRIDFDTHLPFIGTIEWLNILPPLMVVLWIVQQKVMPKPTDEKALQMHKMMMFMPIMFGFFLYNYAAGLSLYMITTSLFGILEQTVIKRIWPLDATEQPKKKSGFMTRLMELQEQAQQQQRGKRGKQSGKQSGKGGKKRKRG